MNIIERFIVWLSKPRVKELTLGESDTHFWFGGKRYSKAEYELVQDPSDSPPMYYMGPDWVWKPDMYVRKK